jgi:two-component system chemotaxis response regulator CheY
MAMDVLIVDDSTAIRKILQRVLHQSEVAFGKIHEAGDGVEALNVLRENTVHLVFADVNMPNMDGLTFLQEMRANSAWADLPVIMITTEGNQATVLEAVRLGAYGYVRKPFTPDQIREKLAGLIKN